MELYILRHGETEWNKSGRLQGQTDILLNENGRALAARTGHAMKEIPFDRVISSPLLRSVETAKLLLSENCGSAGEALRQGRTWFCAEEELKEIGFGVYEGFSVPGVSVYAGDSEYAMSDPEFHFFFDAPEKYQPPTGGESFSQLIDRTGRFLKRLAGEEAWMEERILISTHGAAARALLANIKHTELKDFWDGGVPKNCSVSIVRWCKDGWKLIKQDKIYY